MFDVLFYLTANLLLSNDVVKKPAYNDKGSNYVRECGMLILTVTYRDKQQGCVCATVMGLAVSPLNISLSKMPEGGGGGGCKM